MTRDRAARVAYVSLLGVLALLLVTGVYLAVEYRPAAPGTADLLTTRIRIAHRAREVHRLLSTLAFALSIAVVVLGVTRRRSWLVVLPVLVVVTAVSGYALPWDQVALWAVTVGTGFHGVLRPAFDGDDVRFVILGGVEVSRGAYRTAVLVHLVALPVLLAGFLFVARRVGARTDPSDVEEEPWQTP